MKVNHKWLIALALVLLPLSQISCGDEDTGSSLGVSNVSPKGSIGGVVVDAATGKGLKNVAVSVVAGGKTYAATAKTDDTGVFSITDVPCGAVIIRIISPNTAQYASVDVPDVLVNSAGEFPLDNSTLSVGPVGLIPLATTNDAFRVQIVTADGAPAPNITATLHAGVGFVDFSGKTPAAKGITSVSAKTGTAGLVKFIGMPDFNAMAGLVPVIGDTVRVKVPPLDLDSDGVFDYLGSETIYNATKLTDHVPTIVLSSSATKTLKIEASSIAALAGQTGVRQLTSASGPLYAAFNWPLDSTLTQVSLYDELGTVPANKPTPTVSGNLLTVNFKGLKPGAEYNITINAYATVGKNLISATFGAPFFTPPASGTTVTATLARGSTDSTSADYQKVIITFSEPIGTGKAGQSLTGANSPVYFGYDIDGSGKTGDQAGERGATTSKYPLMILETAPPGLAGLSGFSTRWYFMIPSNSFNSPLPAGTPVDLTFSRINLNVERASGELVADMPALTIPAN